MHPSWERFKQTFKEKYKLQKIFCGTQNKYFHFKDRKVSLENIITWKIKFLVSSLNLCASNELSPVTMMEATKMKQKHSMKD